MLSDVLKYNSTLTKLNLRGDEKEQGEEGRRKREIKKTKWIENSIGAEGAKMISEGLKHNSTLTKLNLGGDIFGGGGYHWLKEEEKIREERERVKENNER